MMKSVQDTVKFLLEFFDKLPTIRIDSRQANGYILREDIIAVRDHPAFPTSAMDGFAVRSADLSGIDEESSQRLTVAGRVSAGIYPETKLEPGQVLEIMTGAIVPEGADAVVPIELTDWFNNPDHNNQFVNINEAVSSGDNIRNAGRDYKAGDLILRSGRDLLGPREIAMIAMLGIPEISVSKKPKIGILASGDELLELGDEWSPGKIYNSNSSLLEQSVIESQAAPYDLGIAEDTEESVLTKLQKAIELELDLVITSAGVSVSDRDIIRIVLEKFGRIHQWKVNLRPGKPLLFGEFESIKILGLPGNPVSTYIGFKKFAVPVIEKLLGKTYSEKYKFHAQLGGDIVSDGRETYIRGKLVSQDGCMIASSVEHQDSGNLKGLVNSDVLIKIPAGIKNITEGSEVEIELIL